MDRLGEKILSYSSYQISLMHPKPVTLDFNLVIPPKIGLTGWVAWLVPWLLGWCVGWLVG